MFNPHHEASAPTARIARSSTSKASLASRDDASSSDHFREAALATAKVSGDGYYASTEPITWRHRHRRPPKNKTPITKAEALAVFKLQRERSRTQLSKHVAREKATLKDSPADWDSDGLIDERTYARLMGDMWQQAADLIARVNANEEGRRKAHKEAFRLSKVGYGRLRAKQSILPPPLPDHVSEWNGEYLVSSIKFYKTMIRFCNKAIKLIEQL